MLSNRTSTGALLVIARFRASRNDDARSYAATLALVPGTTADTIAGTSAIKPPAIASTTSNSSNVKPEA